jgi:hypothetical protein
MMRLSMAHTPGTREATFSALARKFPLLDTAISVTVPLVADTVTPAGASPMPISSLSAALTFVSSSLSASAGPIYDADEYHRHFLLEHLRSVELDANSALVELLRNGRRRVTKKH